MTINVKRTIFIIRKGNAAMHLRLYHFVVLMFIATLFSLTLTVMWSRDAAIKDLHAHALEHLNVYNHYISNKISSFSIPPAVLSQTPHVIEYCKDPIDSDAMNVYLAQFNKTNRSAVSYILNKYGLTIASSNYDSSDSFISKHYGFRNYFKYAVMGQTYSEIAIGITSKKPGYYASHPVRHGDEIVGVVVIKYSLDIFKPNYNATNTIVLIVDNNNVISASNYERYLFHTIGKLPEKTMQEIKDSRQYNTKSLTPLPIAKEIKKGDMTFVTLGKPSQSDAQWQTGNEDHEYLLVSTHFPDNNWRLQILVSLSTVKREILKDVLSMLLVIIIISIAGVFALHRRETRLELEKSEARFRNIFNGTPDAMFIADIETGIIVDVNPAASNLIMVPKEAITGVHYSIFVPNDEEEGSAEQTFKRHAVEARHGESTSPVERELARGDGSSVWVEVIAQKITLQNKVHLLGVFRDITMRKNYESKLKEARDQIQGIIDNSPTVIFLKDTTGRFLLVNKQYEQIFHIKKEKVVGMTDHDIFPEEVAENNRQNDIVILQKLTPQTFEETIPQDDGLHTYISIKFPLFNSNSEPLGVCGIATDITGRKQIESHLRKSEEKYRALFENSPVPIWEEDFSDVKLHFDYLRSMAVTDFREYFETHPEDVYYCASLVKLLDTNSECVRFFNVDSKEDLVRNLPAYFTKESMEVFKEQMIDLAEGKTSFNLEIPIRDLEGNIRQLMLYLSVVPGHEETLSRVYVSFIDITQRKVLENLLKRLKEELEEKVILRTSALQESETKYRQLFELSHAGIWVIDRDCNTTLVNPRMAQMLGYSIEEMTGKDFFSFMYQEWVETCKSELNLSIQGTALQRECGFLRKDGSILYTTIVMSPIRDDSGNYLGSMVGVIDITQQKTLEGQLLHARKMESIGQLSGGIAHEFNNILFAITNYLYLLKRNIKDAFSIELIDNINACAERASNLSKSLLIFSKEQPVNLTVINIVDVVKDMEKILRKLLRDDITFKLLIAENELMVLADRGHIEMALVNLVTNARDAMPNGGTLSLELRQTASNDGIIKNHVASSSTAYALIKVSDTGVGMDTKMIERIYDPFFTTKEVGKGTGLGLSAVYGIVQQHRGYIDVQSRFGEGTSLLILLPLTTPAIQPVKPKQQPKGGNETILIAEDDKFVRDITVRILRRFGYKIIEAVDGKEAVEKFVENKDDINLVILDVMMPLKNGKEAYNEIKTYNPKIKAIFLSGHTFDALSKDDMLKEELNFISKPVSVEELLTKVKTILENML
ncbi:MAG: PAS domain S-box protein [Nitrospirae bacterium]|nr:PAS domain S-box protein [Nitrospirota bacterium]